MNDPPSINRDQIQFDLSLIMFHLYILTINSINNNIATDAVPTQEESLLARTQSHERLIPPHEYQQQVRWDWGK